MAWDLYVNLMHEQTKCNSTSICLCRRQNYHNLFEKTSGVILIVSGAVFLFLQTLAHVQNCFGENLAKETNFFLQAYDCDRMRRKRPDSVWRPDTVCRVKHSASEWHTIRVFSGTQQVVKSSTSTYEGARKTSKLIFVCMRKHKFQFPPTCSCNSSFINKNRLPGTFHSPANLCCAEAFEVCNGTKQVSRVALSWTDSWWSSDRPQQNDVVWSKRWWPLWCVRSD